MSIEDIINSTGAPGDADISSAAITAARSHVKTVMIAASNGVQADMNVALAQFKNNLDDGLTAVQNLLTPPDVTDLSANATKLRQASAALNQYMQSYQQQWSGLGNQLGGVVKSAMDKAVGLI